MKFILKLCTVLICMIGSYVAMHKEQSTDTILEVEKIINPDSSQYIFERFYPGQKPPTSLILCFSQLPIHNRHFRGRYKTLTNIPIISQPKGMCSAYPGVFDISEFLTDLSGDRQTRLVFEFSSSIDIDILCKASDPTTKYGCQVTEQGYTFLVMHLSWLLIGSLLSLVGIICVEIAYAIYSERKQKQ